MGTFLLELKLVWEERIKISIIFLITPFLGALLFTSSKEMFDELTLRQAYTVLFGQIDRVNWIYWTFLWFGYLILLQILWKPHSKYFFYNVILRYKKKYCFWLNRLLLLFFLTMGYVIIYFITVFVLFCIFQVKLQFDFYVVIQYLIVSINLCCHALLWKMLEQLCSSKVATTLLVILFYVGMKISEPYIPLYFAITGNFKEDSLYSVLLVEVILFYFMGTLIVRSGLKKDY